MGWHCQVSYHQTQAVVAAVVVDEVQKAAARDRWGATDDLKPFGKAKTRRVASSSWWHGGRIGFAKEATVDHHHHHHLRSGTLPPWPVLDHLHRIRTPRVKHSRHRFAEDV